MPPHPRDVAELLDLIAAGAKVKYLPFWGHRPEADGSTGRGCLSQWWPARFHLDGLDFATAEHYMMWRKAILFADTEIATQVLEAPHPRQAKVLGRQVRNFEPAVWLDHCFDIVVGGNVAKFGQNEALRDYLLGTGDRILVEASPTDRIWGIGLAVTDDRATRPAEWRGTNLLGFALMQARAALATVARQ